MSIATLGCAVLAAACAPRPKPAAAPTEPDFCAEFRWAFDLGTPRYDVVTRATPPRYLRRTLSELLAVRVTPPTPKLAPLVARLEENRSRWLPLLEDLATTVERRSAEDYVAARDEVEPLLKERAALYAEGERYCAQHRKTRSAPNNSRLDGGRLDPDIIQRRVRNHFHVFRDCYDQGLTRDGTLRGRVTTRFVIQEFGVVSDVSVGGRPLPRSASDAEALAFLEKVNGSLPSYQDAETTLPDEEVIECVAKGYAELVFPKPEGGIVTVVYPIMFAQTPEPPESESFRSSQPYRKVPSRKR